MPNPLSGFAAVLAPALFLPALATTLAPSQQPTDLANDDAGSSSNVPLFVGVTFVVLAAAVLACVIVRRDLHEDRRLQAEADASSFNIRTGGNGNENGGREVALISIPNASFSPVTSSATKAANVDRRLPSLPSLAVDGAEPAVTDPTPLPIDADADAGGSPHYEAAPGQPAVVAAPGEVVYGASAPPPSGGILYDTSPAPEGEPAGSALTSGGQKPAAAAAAAGGNAMYSVVAKPSTHGRQQQQQSPPSDSCLDTAYASPMDVARSAGHEASGGTGHGAQDSEPTYDFKVLQGEAVAEVPVNADRFGTGNQQGTNAIAGGGDQPAYYESAPAALGRSKAEAPLYATVADATSDAAIPEPTFEHSAAEYITRPMWLHQVNRPEAERLLGDPAQAQAVNIIRYLVRPDQKVVQAFVLSFVAAGRAQHTKFGQDSNGAFKTVRQGSIVKLGPTVNEAVPKMLAYLANNYKCESLVPVEKDTAAEVEV